jgi:predicted RNase H-like nuclease (RuvC/YqgF family)
MKMSLIENSDMEIEHLGKDLEMTKSMVEKSKTEIEHLEKDLEMTKSMVEKRDKEIEKRDKIIKELSEQVFREGAHTTLHDTLLAIIKKGKPFVVHVFGTMSSFSEMAHEAFGFNGQRVYTTKYE